MAAATAQKQQTEQQPAPAQSRGAVAVIAPPRLPYHESIEERFGVDKSAWKALCESVFPTAKTSGAIVLALSYCKARKLDPFKKPVHIVPIWDAAKGAFVESVWPGIGEHRTTAFRTGSYAGMDMATFGPDTTETFEDKVKGKNGWQTMKVSVTFPLWAQITLYRIIQGQRVSFPGPRVYWKEFYSRIGRSTIPNERWQKAPYQMAEKCSEAGALRRAFPEELGEDWTAEEAGFFGGAGARDITPDAPTVPAEEPKRADFRKVMTDVEDIGDGEEFADEDDESTGAPAGDAPGPDASTSQPDAGPGATGAQEAEGRNWTMPTEARTTVARLTALTDMVAAAQSAGDLRDIRFTHADLLKSWSAGKPGSDYAKASAAFDQAEKAKAAELAA